MSTTIGFNFKDLITLEKVEILINIILTSVLKSTYVNK